MTTETNAKKLLVKTFTKETTIGEVMDNNPFKFSKRKSATIWRVILRNHPDLKKGRIAYTSTTSNKSDVTDKKTKVYVA